jgi:hypothetical protein
MQVSLAMDNGPIRGHSPTQTILPHCNSNNNRLVSNLTVCQKGVYVGMKLYNSFLLKIKRLSYSIEQFKAVLQDAFWLETSTLLMKLYC